MPTSVSRILDAEATVRACQSMYIDVRASMESYPKLEDFDQFVLYRRESLVREAFLLVGDHGLAEDLVQVTLTAAWNRWAQIAEGDPTRYVRKILINQARYRVRRKWRGEMPTAAGDMPALLQDNFEDDSNLAAFTIAFLARLPVRQRATVILRFYCDLSEHQTAEVMACSQGTVKSQTAKALAKLRRMVEESEEAAC